MPERHVTNAELKAELDKVPTKWEVRTLILAAIFLNSFLPPAQEVARAASVLLR